MKAVVGPKGWPQTGFSVIKEKLSRIKYTSLVNIPAKSLLACKVILIELLFYDGKMI